MGWIKIGGKQFYQIDLYATGQVKFHKQKKKIKGKNVDYCGEASAQMCRHEIGRAHV